MGLSCSCYDFDKNECDEWWEQGRDSIPPEGARCCECGAMIPTDDEVHTFLLMETYNVLDTMDDADYLKLEQEIGIHDWVFSEGEKNEKRIRDYLDAEITEGYFPDNLVKHFPNPYIKLSEEQEDKLEKALDNFRDEHGWCCEDDRYEKCVKEIYRCERCSGIAESIEALGYCLISPGEVPECHEEYTATHGGIRMHWVKDENGILNPRIVR